MLDPNLLEDEMRDEYNFSNAKRGNPYLTNSPRPIVVPTFRPFNCHSEN